MGVFTISHWVATSPEEVWNAYTTPDELVDNPEVIEAFRSTFRKMGRLFGIDTENRLSLFRKDSYPEERTRTDSGIEVRMRAEPGSRTVSSRVDALSESFQPPSCAHR